MNIAHPAATQVLRACMYVHRAKELQDAAWSTSRSPWMFAVAIYCRQQPGIVKVLLQLVGGIACLLPCSQENCLCPSP